MRWTIPGAGNAADPRKLPRAMVEQGIDQCPVGIACRRMDDQAGGFVHDQQMLILEDDRQRDVLRRVVRRFGFGNGQAEALATPDLGRAGSRTARPSASSAPLRIRFFSRSRERVGTASASAWSSRQPAWVAARSTSIV